jgi:hypothetical protein
MLSYILDKVDLQFSSDTLKRHEKLHSADAAELEQQSLKRKASAQLSRSPPLSKLGLFHANDIKPQPIHVLKPSPEKLSFMGHSDWDSPTKVSASSTYDHLVDEMDGPFAPGGFTPVGFDVDLAALNQFLTSGDLDAFASATAAPIQPETLPIPPKNTLPIPSDAIRAAWFTNMEEGDLLAGEPMSRASVVVDSPPASSNTPVRQSGDSNDSDRNPGDEIDKAWRTKVGSKLIPPVFNVVNPLPSIDFLVCAYFPFLTCRTVVLNSIFRGFTLWCVHLSS